MNTVVPSADPRCVKEALTLIFVFTYPALSNQDSDDYNGEKKFLSPGDITAIVRLEYDP